MKEKKYPYQNLSLEDMKGEVWEDVPGLDGVYLISNFGRIKSLRRWVEREFTGGYWTHDRIVRCCIQKQILLTGKRTHRLLRKTIVYNGKSLSISIARTVYNLFVKKIDFRDRSVIVTYKDEDAFNICPSNLLLTNPSESGLRSYKKNIRPRDAFGNNPLPVSQYDEKGNFLNSFSSISEASQKTGINSANICNALHGKINLRCGFLWNWGDNKKEGIVINSATRKKIEVKKKYNTCISQYDLSGNKIKTHSNIKAAADSAGCSSYQIMQVVLNKAFSVNKFYWKPGNGPQKIDVGHIIEKKSELLQKILCRPTLQLDENKKIIKEYPSATAAAEAMKTKPANIHSAVNKKHRTSGFYWRYKTEKRKKKLPI